MDCLIVLYGVNANWPVAVDQACLVVCCDATVDPGLNVTRTVRVCLT